MGEKIDWRYRVVTTLAENAVLPSGKLAKKGSYVSVSTFFKRFGKDLVIGDPSAPALFISHAYRSFIYASRIDPIKFFIDNIGENESLRSEKIFDYLESVMTSIIFAYSSLEAYTNEEIPHDYIYEEPQRRSGILVPRDKKNIERYVNLDIKLTEILPNIKKCSSPKGLKIWSDYKKLKKLRDRLIHLKSSDRAHTNYFDKYPDSIWKDLLTKDLENHALIAKNIILHYCDKKNLPFWILNCPF